MANKRNYQVYGLYCVCGCDPYETIRYVGQASMGARDRFNKHRYSAKNEATWPVSRWMRKHGVESIRYTILDTLDTGDEMDSAEEYWIDKLGTLIDENGYNITPGGNGVRGYTHAPWARSRLTHETSQETRDKISATLTGKYAGENASNRKATQAQAEEVIARYWKGETIAQIAEATGLSFSTVSGISCGQAWKYLERPTTPRLVISSGKFSKGSLPKSTKLGPDKVREIRRRYDAGERPRDIGPEYGVTPENVSMIGLRKTWKHVD